MLWGFALSGFAALGYEVVWTRLLSIFSMVRYRFFLYAGLLPYGLGAAWAYWESGTLDGPIFWSGLGGVVFAVVGAIPSHVLGGTLDHIGLLAFAGLGIWTLIASVILTTTDATT